MPMRRGNRGSGRLRPAANRPFGRELFLELLEGQLQCAQPLRLQQLHLQLILAANLVDIDAAARQHCQAIGRLELPVAVRGAESHALELRVGFLEGEIIVAARGQLEAGNLARNPDIAELFVEDGANGGIELADGEDAPLRRQVEFERELLHRVMVSRKVAKRDEASQERTGGTWPDAPVGGRTDDRFMSSVSGLRVEAA